MGQWNFSPTLPFLVIPGAAIPKLRQLGRFRIIWDASVPKQSSSQSAADNGGGITSLIATNMEAELQSYTSIAFVSI